MQRRVDIQPSITNLQLYLDYNSNHPQHCKEGLIYSQALRIVERCSKAGDVEEHFNNLKEKLMDRNYPEKLVDEKFRKAKQKNRRELIFQARKQQKSDDKVRLLFTHSSANPPIHKWVRESKKQLLRNDEAKNLGKRIQIASKQPKNLQRLVTSSNFLVGGKP